MRPNYNCGQQELYTICRAGWAACSHSLAAFSAVKAKYTPAYIATQIANVQAASELPDAVSRSGNSEIYRIDLVKLGLICTNTFLQLKLYIIEAYPVEEQATRLNMAGRTYYYDATNQNWDSVNGLNSAAGKFINDNLAELTANMNMPATFPAEFEAARDAFSAQHELFINETNFLAKLTSDKVEANNNIYQELMSMLREGQTIFKGDKATKKQFTFSQLHYLANGAGTSGIKGIIIDAVSDMPIEGVEISIPKKRRTTTTDKDGHYEIIQLASGIYKAKFSKTGYLPIIMEDLEVKLGTTSTLNQFMTPAPQNDNES